MNSVDDLVEYFGGFSRPSKPACLSYSLPRAHCKAGSRLAKINGTTCSMCYAKNGYYCMPNVKKAMNRRMWAVKRAHLSKSNYWAWIEGLSAGINKQYENTMRRATRHGNSISVNTKVNGLWFRWHDSGDLQSDIHLRMIFEVASATPNVWHLLPTREITTVDNVISTPGVNVPENLKIMLSAPVIGVAPDSILMKLAHRSPKNIGTSMTFSTKQSAFTNTMARSKGNPVKIKICPASTKKIKTCSTCRFCWTKVDVDNCVAFKIHR